jgi:hypothetical protein
VSSRVPNSMSMSSGGSLIDSSSKKEVSKLLVEQF